MDKLDKEISKELKRICHVGENGGVNYPVMSGKVVSVDEGEFTCKVALSKDDADTNTEDIYLNANLTNKGLILYPKVGSIVWVAEIDGPGQHGVIKCSEITKAEVRIGGLVFVMDANKVQVDLAGYKWLIDNTGVTVNDGSYGGVPNSINVASKMGAIATDVNQLKIQLTALQVALTADVSGTPLLGPTLGTFLAGIGTYAATALTLPTAAEIENVKFKQGV